MYFAIQDFYAILLQTFQNIFSKLLLHSCFQQVFLEILHFQFQALLLFLLVKSRKTVWQLTAFFQKGMEKGVYSGLGDCPIDGRRGEMVSLLFVNGSK